MAYFERFLLFKIACKILNDTFVVKNAVFITKTAFWTHLNIYVNLAIHLTADLLFKTGETGWSTKPTGKTIKYQLSELRLNMIVALLKKTLHFILTEMKIGPWIFSETDTEKCPKPSRPVI